MKFKINTDTPGSKYDQVNKDRRGVIKGSLKTLPPRKGGDKTNEEYAKEHGITRRQASKQRRGY